jgi:hypothetical protein
MCGTVMRGADALPGSEATSRAKGTHRKLGDLVSARRLGNHFASYRLRGAQYTDAVASEGSSNVPPQRSNIKPMAYARRERPSAIPRSSNGRSGWPLNDGLATELICPTTDFPKSLSSLQSKNNSLYQKRKSGLWFVHPALMRRGASADRHERWTRDAMDALEPEDERRTKRTAKSCGPDSPTLGSSFAGLHLRSDGGYQARHSREITYKP